MTNLVQDLEAILTKAERIPIENYSRRRQYPISCNDFVRDVYGISTTIEVDGKTIPLEIGLWSHDAYNRYILDNEYNCDADVRIGTITFSLKIIKKDFLGLFHYVNYVIDKKMKERDYFYHYDTLDSQLCDKWRYNYLLDRIDTLICRVLGWKTQRQQYEESKKREKREKEERPIREQEQKNAAEQELRTFISTPWQTPKK